MFILNRWERKRGLPLLMAWILAFMSLAPSAGTVYADEGDVVWPAFVTYVDRSGTAYFDPSNEPGISPDDVDFTSGAMKGIGDRPSFYVGSDAEYLYFRMRLLGDPRDTKGGFLSSVWMVQLYQNGSQIATVGLDGKSPHIDYTYVANPSGSSVLKLEQTDSSGRAVPGTAVSEDTNGDYFLDFRIAKSGIATIAPSVDYAGLFQFSFATSKSANLSVINKEEASGAGAYAEAAGALEIYLPTIAITGMAASGAAFPSTISGTTTQVQDGETVTLTITSMSSGVVVHTKEGVPVASNGWTAGSLPAQNPGTYEIVATVTNEYEDTATTSQMYTVTSTESNVTINDPESYSTFEFPLSFSGTYARSGGGQPNVGLKIYKLPNESTVIAETTFKVNGSGPWTGTFASYPGTLTPGSTYKVVAYDTAVPSVNDVQIIHYVANNLTLSAPGLAGTQVQSVNPMPTIAGTASANETVALYIDNVFFRNVVADENGDWTTTIDKPLAPNPGSYYAFTAKVFAGGDESTAVEKTVGYRVLSYDVSIENELVEGEEGDYYINNVEPTFRGKSTDTTVNVTIEDQTGDAEPISFSNVTVINNKWSVDVAGSGRALEDGHDYLITVSSVQDPTKTAVLLARVKVSTYITILPAPDSVVGANQALSGKADPEADIALIVDGTSAAETKADENGDWSYAGFVWTETHQIAATASDFVGNTASASTTLHLNGTVTNYTVTFDSDGGTAVNAVSVLANAKLTAPADPAKDGFIFLGWYTEGLTDAYDFDAAVTANMTLYAKWGTKPAAPTVRISEDANDDGYINLAELSGDIDVVAGLPDAAKAGDVLLLVAGATTREVTLNADMVDAGESSVAFPAALDGATFEVVATITDEHALTSDEATDAAVVDTTAPTRPTVTTQTTNDTTPAIHGTAIVEPGGTLTVTVSGAVYGVGEHLTLAGTNWTLQIPSELAAGTYDVTATSVDAAGNASTDATSEELTVKTGLEIGPIDMTDGTDTGTSADDELTNHGLPVLTFEGEPGLTIVLEGPSSVTLDVYAHYDVAYDGGTYTVKLLDAAPGAGESDDPFGTYAAGMPTGNDANVGDGTYTLKVTDDAGNEGTVGTFEIDTTAPTAPTVVPLETDDTTPTIEGAAALGAGESLTVEVDGVSYEVGAHLTFGAGAWALTVPNALALGTYDVTATASDEAGNAATDATAEELTIAATPTAKGGVTGVLRSSTGGVVSGIAVVALNGNGDVIGSSTTDDTGVYLIEELPAGPMTVAVRNSTETLVSADVAIPAEDVVEQDLTLPSRATLTLDADPANIVGDGKSTSALTATLLDLEGAAIEGATVRYDASAGVVSVDEAVTDAEGRAAATLTAPQLSGVEPREETLLVVVRDLERGVFAEEEITITLLPASIQGIVMSGGKPVANAVVTIDMVIDGVPFTVSAVTGPDGRYTLVIPKVDFTYIIQVKAPIVVEGKTVLVEFEQSTTVGEDTAPGETVAATNKIAGHLFIAGAAGADGPLTIGDVLTHSEPIIGRIFTADGEELLGKSLTIGPDGKYQFDQLPKGTYSLLFQINAPTGERLAGIRKTVTIGEDGEIVIEPGLIDPYGIVRNAVTNEPVEGVDMRLYWADTELNASYGRTPHTLVPLPVLGDFAPNENRNPQSTTAAGEYAWMVFADGDYYLIGEKDGYLVFDSREDDREVDLDDSWIRDGIIHVGETIVEYDFSMDPILTAPAAPTELRAEDVTETSAVLIWNPVGGPGAIVYDLYRDGILLAGGLTGTTYEDEGLSLGTTYVYEVVARNVVGSSPKSNPAEVRIQSLDEINEDIKDALKKLKVQYAPGDIWESITLPLFLVKDGTHQTVVGWTSSNEEVIKVSAEAVYDDDENGAMEFVASVNRKSTDTSVILTATVSKGSGTPLSRTFLLIVKSTAVEEAKETKPREESKVTVNGKDVAVDINRTVLSNGNKIDKLIVSTGAMDDLLDANEGSPELKLEFGDMSEAGVASRADELAVEVPIGAIDKLTAANALHVATPEGSVKLPGATLTAIQDMGTDVFFRIVPVRDAAKLTDIADEAKQQAAVQAAIGTGEAEFLDIPRQIETNYTGLATEVVLPLTRLTIPAEPVARQRFLDSLRVYIQHSDGTKRVVGGSNPGDIPGTIVYEGGTPVGIAFTITKFSTFTMFRVADAAPAPVVFIPPALPAVEVVSTNVNVASPEAGVIEITLTRPPGDVVDEAFTVTVGGKPVAVEKVEVVGEKLILHTAEPIPPGYQVVVVYRVEGAAGALASFELEWTNADKHEKYINGYPDRTFKPANDITRAEVAAILTRLLGRGGERRQAVSYPDVASSHWASSSIEVMTETGIMEGYDDGEFKPDRPITRGEFAAVLLRFLGRADVAAAAPGTAYAFPDIADHWAKDLIVALNDAGIMLGEDGKFYPRRNLSRAEAVTAINRAIGRGELIGDFSPSWPDVPKSHWAYGHVEEASRTHEYTRVNPDAEQWIRFLD
ncbi:S-layer homology domain-containing protein [Paenibacillus sp.]|uniref:S-layer homology domain-containing protein n=1 Tax=Paenibacillus sp. TaxID=58172 RepID=UPI002D542CF5|nr:Ig-like domain-containing protein [Paenibacillus sp.]HZG58604.1 Ig-like domain-containing protein [Paenibacillus sp.]